MVKEDDGAPIVAMSDTAAECLVHGPESLRLVPLVAIQQLSFLSIAVVVFLLEDNGLVVQSRIRDADCNDGTCIVVDKVESFAYLAPIDGEEDGAGLGAAGCRLCFLTCLDLVVVRRDDVLEGAQPALTRFYDEHKCRVPVKTCLICSSRSYTFVSFIRLMSLFRKEYDGKKQSTPYGIISTTFTIDWMMPSW